MELEQLNWSWTYLHSPPGGGTLCSAGQWLERFRSADPPAEYFHKGKSSDMVEGKAGLEWVLMAMVAGKGRHMPRQGLRTPPTWGAFCHRDPHPS